MEQKHKKGIIKRLEENVLKTKIKGVNTNSTQLEVEKARSELIQSNTEKEDEIMGLTLDIILKNNQITVL